MYHIDDNDLGSNDPAAWSGRYTEQGGDAGELMAKPAHVGRFLDYGDCCAVTTAFTMKRRCYRQPGHLWKP